MDEAEFRAKYLLTSEDYEEIKREVDAGQKIPQLKPYGMPVVEPEPEETALKVTDNDSSYSNAVAMAGGILDGTDDDTTQGALYYANLKYASSGWFFQHIVQDTVNHPALVTIGHQTFFR